jgi:hypothetical protein
VGWLVWLRGGKGIAGLNDRRQMKGVPELIMGCERNLLLSFLHSILEHWPRFVETVSNGIWTCLFWYFGNFS